MGMRIAAGIVGVIGGLLGTFAGFANFSDASDTSGDRFTDMIIEAIAPNPTGYLFAALLAIVGLVGAGIAFARPKPVAFLLLLLAAVGGAVAWSYAEGFDALPMPWTIPGVLLLIAGGLAAGARNPAKRSACPYCREPVQVGATVCPHCQRDLQTATA